MTDAIYARVSSDRQEQEATVQSQLAELRAHLIDAEVADWREFTDEGFSRDDLRRPSLDNLRDLAAEGGVDTLYVQAPDRLASGAKLIILVEEFQQKGVAVNFLKGSVEATPEGKLLLHMQGAIAEYERTKIAERTRRGKLYWAKQGAMVGGRAPYGYRLVRRVDSQRASLAVSEIEATVVREMFRLVSGDRLTMRGLARHLESRGISTPRGANQWSPTSVDRILRNPVYKGTFFYQRTEAALPSKRLTNDPYKQSRKTGSKPRPQSDWIEIPVPALVDEATWVAVQEQLHQNGLHSPRNNKRHRYLLRGLIRCPRCGGNYTGYSSGGHRAYRCQNHDPAVTSTGKRCKPGRFSAQPVEDAVWSAVTEAMRQPEMLAGEYKRRVVEAGHGESQGAERKQLALALKRAKTREDRITDAYINEAMDLVRYKTEMDRLRQHRAEIERHATRLERRQRQDQDARDALEHLSRFCHRISEGLSALTFDERQQLLRLVVEGITVDNGRVRVDTIIPTGDSNLRNRYPEPVEGRRGRWFDKLTTNGIGNADHPKEVLTAGRWPPRPQRGGSGRTAMI